jgi:hypothetical protein
MILYNPSEEEQRFYYGHIPYVFRSKESRTLPDEVGKWGLKRGNRNLVEYSPVYDEEMLVTDMNYDTMPWKKVISLASARGLYGPRMGLKRERVLELLKQYDDTKARTLSEPSNQEEGEGSQGPVLLQ